MIKRCRQIVKMTTKCEIKYDGFDDIDGNPTFYAGDTISGTVVLTLMKPKRHIGMHLQLRGYAQTGWTQGVGKSAKSYSAMDEYYNKQIPLIVGDKTEKDLMPGVYKYPFTHYFEPHLPSSFECE